MLCIEVLFPCVITCVSCSQICKSTKQQEGGNLPSDDSQEHETSVELSQLTTGGEASTVGEAEDSDGSSRHTKCHVVTQTGDSSGNCKALVRTSVL